LTKKEHRHKTQKKWITIAFHQDKPIITLPCYVKLTRVAPRHLDGDNLQVAMKWLRDSIADHIIPGLAVGRADGDERIIWQYDQEKGLTRQYGVKIEISKT
jgi:hypothetical protein